ncbi:MAG TPA: hypothetical protein VLR94_11230 [Acidobacteriota bacterium]|nr:hypothetical protein [Acidobacteriota bacterium]
MKLRTLLPLVLLPLQALDGQAPSLPADLPATGWMRVRFSELPTPEIRPVWFPYNFNPGEESFELYIPPDRPGDPYGFLGWTNPEEVAETPRKFEPLLNEYHLIALSADRCGNEQLLQRRVGLLTSGLLQLKKHIRFDPNRLILSGFSGGGRTAATGCFAHPEIWRGAICWAGGNFYKKYSLPMPVGASSPGINNFLKNAVTAKNVKLARANARFVLISGPKDFNLNDCRGIYRALRQDGFRALMIEEPGMSHEVGSVDSMRKALEFVLGTPDS